jgi:hypothetical protein
MGIMMLAWLLVLVVVALVMVRLATPRLPPTSTTEQDRLLAQQGERIDQLEEELLRLKEQADFTERLLTERSEAPPDDDGEAD